MATDITSAQTELWKFTVKTAKGVTHLWDIVNRHIEQVVELAKAVNTKFHDLHDHLVDLEDRLAALHASSRVHAKLTRQIAEEFACHVKSPHAFAYRTPEKVEPS